MSNLFYVLKIGVATFLIVVLMQIHVGEKTVESHMEQFIRKSSLFEPLRVVAHGGFLMAKNAYLMTIKTVDSFVTKQFRAENSPGQRKLAEIKRSLAFQKQQEKKLEREIQNPSQDEAEASAEDTYE